MMENINQMGMLFLFIISILLGIPIGLYLNKKQGWHILGGISFGTIIVFIFVSIIGYFAGSYIGFTSVHSYYSSLFSQPSAVTAITTEREETEETNFLPVSKHFPTKAPQSDSNVSQSSSGFSNKDVKPRNCTNWSDITTDDIGKTICAYGVVKYQEFRGNALFIVFSDDPNDFYFISYGDWYYDGLEDHCAMAQGEVEQLSGIPMMVVDADDVYRCE
jgi:hypothetical protein